MSNERTSTRKSRKKNIEAVSVEQRNVDHEKMSKTEVATYVHHLSLSNVDLFHWPKLLSIDLVNKDYVNWHTVSLFICYAGVSTICSQ
jgi:hypothetical protein